MLREKSKWRSHEDESTDAEHRGGTARSSDEASVMGVERRGCVIQFLKIGQPEMGGANGQNKAGCCWPDDGSRMC